MQKYRIVTTKVEAIFPHDVGTKTFEMELNLDSNSTPSQIMDCIRDLIIIEHDVDIMEAITYNVTFSVGQVID